jgi:hypothetical protein
VRRIAALAFLVPLLAGCGSATSVSGDASPEILAAAVDKTTKAESLRMGFRVALEAAGQSGDMKGEGVFDYRRNAGQMQMDLSGLDQGMEDVELIVDGDIIYMRGFDDELPAGKTWMKIDTSKVAGAPQLGLSRLNQPAVELQYLRAASESVETKGLEKVRGVETTRYHTVIDLSKLAAEAADEAPPRLRKQIRQEAKKLLAETEIDELPTDVWIDADGLLRKMAVDFSFAAEGDTARMHSTVEFFDFGVPVQVSRPPASETFDLRDLESGG